MSGVLGTQAYKQYFGHPVSYTQGAITAAMPAGSFVGSLLSSFLADRLSRKAALQVSCVFWIAGSAVQCSAQNIPMLCAGRGVAGVCVGVASSVVPIYQVSERAGVWPRANAQLTPRGSLRLRPRRFEDESSGWFTPKRDRGGGRGGLSTM